MLQQQKNPPKKLHTWVAYHNVQLQAQFSF